MKEIKDKVITIIIFISVIVFTIAAIQLVSIGVDLLRKKLNLDTEQQKKEQVEKQELNKQNIENNSLN